MAQENNKQKNAEEVDENQLRKVRREKLAELVESGNNPFEITKFDRTHHSQDIRDRFEELEGKSVRMPMSSRRLLRVTCWMSCPSMRIRPPVTS